MPDSSDSVTILSIQLSCVDQYTTNGLVIAKSASFYLCITYASLYSAPNGVAVDFTAMMVAKSFSIDITTVPVLTILKIVH